MVRSSRPLTATVDDEIVMLCPDQGAYFGPNSVGSRVWELIEQPSAVADICRTLTAEFDVADPVGEFGRMAAFAGLPVSRDDVVAAVEAARFDRLRAQESQRGFRERIHEGARFFRRGVVGSWRDELPVELVRRIEADHADVMARYGYPALA